MGMKDAVSELNGYSVEQVIAKAAEHGIRLTPQEIETNEFGECTIDGEVWWSWVAENRPYHPGH